MSQWFRLWEDMPTDPKWRVIAKRSGRPLPEVLSIFVFMMTNAAQSASRGNLENWNDEDVAAALDMESEYVAAIRSAMQGKTLDGDRLSGWEKRQPAREDGSAERAKAWRERQKPSKNATKRNKTTDGGGERERTQSNAAERPEEKREDTEKIREEGSVLSDGRQAAADVESNPELEILDPEPVDPETRLFAEGKTLLGPKSGGVIKNLLKAHHGDVAAAQARIDRAKRAQDPHEFIAGCIRQASTGPPTGTTNENRHIAAIRELLDEHQNGSVPH